MSSARRDQGEAVPPGQLPNVPPELPGSTQTRLVIQALEAGLKEVKDDIKDIKSHRHADFVHMVELFGAGFVLLAGMIITAYFIIDSKFDKSDTKSDKITERVDKLSNTSTRIEVKLEDLLARVPPVQAPFPQASAPQKPK